MNAFELITNRIVPIPKQVTQLDGAPLKRASHFEITAPTAEYGPVKTAAERIRMLLSGTEGDTVTVTLSIEDAPFEMRVPEEGYRLVVTENAVTITGFGEKGLLYGVITLEQLFARDPELPALEVLDWPENPIRGFNEESRYGSNVMQRHEWMAMLEDIASKKMNTLNMTIYGCWAIQYDGRVSQCLFMPVESRPELKTPMVVKYYSPEQQTWIEEEKLPPISCGNVLEEVFAKARDLGIQVVPTWNSFGHNTLLPTVYPEVAPVSEDGVPQKSGFCTSARATYDLLFDIFDQLVDKYMLPYGMEMVNLGLDEVAAEIGKDDKDPFAKHDPWCKCPACRTQDKGDIFINHAVKLIAYLKKKGIKSVLLYCDMIQEGRVSRLGWLGDRLMDACRAANVEDTLVVDWWSYHDIHSKNWIKTMCPEKGMRGIVAPWNGYHTWSITLQPLRNAEILSEVNHRDNGEGMVVYSMWDRACDRTHVAVAEYGWDSVKAGNTKEVTQRHVLRHFPTRAKEAYRAYRLMDYAIEQRHTTYWSYPDKDAISNMDLLTYRLSPYNFSYVSAGKPYPRAFLDEALEYVLTMREDVERALYTVSTMGREAKEIFASLAADPAGDSETAWRQLCECENYQVLAEDWLAILEMHDLCAKEEYALVAQIARKRYEARLQLLTHWEQHKERCVAEGMGLRLQSIFMQIFDDIATFAQKPHDRHWDLMNVYDMLSPRSFWLR